MRAGIGHDSQRCPPGRSGHGIHGVVLLNETQAAQSVKINGYIYARQTSYVVTIRPGGSFSIRDSNRSGVTRTAVNGEALVEKGDTQ